MFCDAEPGVERGGLACSFGGARRDELVELGHGPETRKVQSQYQTRAGLEEAAAR